MSSAGTPTEPSDLLLVDYPGQRRSLRLAELGLGRASGRAEVDLLQGGLPVSDDPGRYVEALLDGRCLEAGAVVVAYCAAAPLASALAAASAAALLVLVDPEQPDLDALSEVFAQCLEGLGVPQLPAWWGPEVRDDLSGLLDRAAAELREVVGARLGVIPGDTDNEEVDALVGWYLDWLRYVVVVMQLAEAPPASVPAWTGETTVVWSPSGVDPAVVRQEVAAAVGRLVAAVPAGNP